jgi:hypothetical protein
MSTAKHCSLCERPADPRSEFCEYHAKALRMLEDAYATWSSAYDGELTKEEYYTRLLARTETGQTITTLINHIRGKGAETSQ